MLDILLDGIIDTLKLMPYLCITFIILEFLEHKMNKKNESILKNSKKVGPIIGGALGGLPQCGFSAMASNLFSSKVITKGTLIAIFLSTSDEMLPIMVSKKVELSLLLRIIGFKVLIGIIVGLIIDIIFYPKEEKSIKEITHLCEEEHCDCNNHGIIYSSIIHTLKISFFILIVNILLNILISKIGEDNLSNILLNKNILTYFLASFIGLIPNCASSVILTELYLQNMITIGTLLAGLLTGSGIGLLVLFKTNKNFQENIKILATIYLVGVILGIIIDFII